MIIVAFGVGVIVGFFTVLIVTVLLEKDEEEMPGLTRTDWP